MRDAKMIMPGTVLPQGTVGAVYFFGGRLPERYYFLIDKHGTVKMIPEDCLLAELKDE